MKFIFHVIYTNLTIEIKNSLFEKISMQLSSYDPSLFGDIALMNLLDLLKYFTLKLVEII